MAAKALPDHQPGAPEVSGKLLDEGEAIVAGAVGGRAGTVQAQALVEWRYRKRAGHREAIRALPTRVAGGLALGSPRAPHGGVQHKAALIEQDNGAALTPGFL
jgi:hypothetical protein